MPADGAAVSPVEIVALLDSMQIVEQHRIKGLAWIHVANAEFCETEVSAGARGHGELGDRSRQSVEQIHYGIDGCTLVWEV